MEQSFFSYSRSDSAFVLKLAQDLRTAGVQLWLDQIDIKPGSRWDSSIETALRSSQRLIVVLSPASVESNNVMDEVSYALETGKTVIPILLADCTVPFRLRRLQHIDFTKDYETGFRQLIQIIGTTKDPDAPQISDTPIRSVEAPVYPKEPQKTETGPSPFVHPQPVKNERPRKPLLTGLGIITLLLVGFGIWYFRQDSGIRNIDQIGPDSVQTSHSKDTAVDANAAAQRKIDSILASHSERDSMAAELQRTRDSLANAKKQRQEPQNQPQSNSPTTNTGTATKTDCPVWKTNLEMIKRTYSRQMGANGKTFANRAFVKKAVSSIDLRPEKSLISLKNKLLRLLSTAPAHRDNYYDMEFTAAIADARDDLELAIQRQAAKCP